MKKLTLLLLLTCLISACSKEAKTLKIASFNIRNTIGIDDIRDPERTAAAIKQINADVIAIQEIDSVTQRSQSVDVLKDLAKRTQMNYTFASAIEFSGGSYGVGVLSKEKPITSYKIPLPGAEEKRVLLVCEFQDYVFLATHFSLTEKDVLESVGIIEREAEKWSKPLFLAGDLNIEPNSEAYKKLSQKFEAISCAPQPTFPADTPTVCIDYILKKRGDNTAVKTSQVVNEPKASDHRPIEAEVEIEK